jgi:putative PIN family toxin of toxin-antitoxin system
MAEPGTERVVLDTNLLVAAAYNPASASRRLVEACLRGELSAIISPAVRREYEHILARAVRGGRYAEPLRAFLERAAVVEPAAVPRVVPDDSDDDKLVALALAAGAVLVTNDAHLLAVAGHRGLRVVRPGELPAKTAGTNPTARPQKGEQP